MIKKIKEAFIDIPSLDTRFEKALKTGNNPDFDAIDQIISNPAWQSNRHGRRQSRQLELMTINHMISQAANLLDDQKNTNLDGISKIVNRPSWQLIYSQEKTQFEHRLLTFLEEVIHELTEKGRASSAFRRIEFFYATMEDRSIINKLNNKINDCRQRREKFRAYIADSIENISQSTQNGKFAQAQAISEQLYEEAPDREDVKKAQTLIQYEKQIFEQTIKEIQQIIDSENLDTAVEKLNKLKTRYPDISQIASMHESLQKRISEDFIKQTLDLEKQGNPEKACLWLENRIRKYPDFISLPSLVRESSEACALFSRCMDFMETQAIESLEKMDINTFSSITQKAESYQHQVPIKANNTLKQIRELTDGYITAEKDNDLKKKRELMNHLEHKAKSAHAPLMEGCELLKIKQQLSEQAETWEIILAHIPATETEIRHNLGKLREIQLADNGEYGNRAASGINDLNQELKRHKINQLRKNQTEAEAEANWPKAIEYLTQVQDLDPAAEYPSKRTAELRQKIDKENSILEDALDRKKENFLKTARQRIEPLAQFSSVKGKAESLVQKLDEDMKNIHEQAATLWKEASDQKGIPLQDFEFQLYQLNEPELERLSQSVKDQLNHFKDSETLSARNQLLDQEKSARENLAQAEELEKQVENAGHHATLADYRKIAETVETALEHNPGYPPLKNMLDKWNSRTRERLLTNYKTQADQKRFHAAVTVLKDWQIYLKSGNMEQEITRLFGEEFGFPKLKDLMEQAAHTSSLARDAYKKFDIKAARSLSASALEICKDDPAALDMAKRLDDWDKGTNMLQKADKILEKYELEPSAAPDEARKLLDQIKQLPIGYDLLDHHMENMTARIFSCLERMDTGACSAITKKIKSYQYLTTHVTASMAQDQVKGFLNDYLSAARKNDLKKRMENLDLLEYQARLLGVSFKEDCEFFQIKESLSRLSEEWESLLVRKPETDTEIEQDIENLNEIIASDEGEYGNLAAGRVSVLTRDLNTLKIRGLRKKQAEAETIADWPNAVKCLKLIKKLDPATDYAPAKLIELEKKIDHENLTLKTAIEKKEARFLNHARQLVQPLIRFSSVKEKANILARELDEETHEILTQAKKLWDKAASETGIRSNETGMQLYLLKEHELDKLTQSTKELLNRFKDSDEISARIERLDRENAVRGRLARITELETKVKQAGDQATLADYGLLVERVEDTLKESPEYTPLQNILNYWYDRIRETLLTNYKTHADQKKFHAAKAVLQDWRRYYKTTDMEQEVRKAFGDEFGFFMLDEFMNQAARESFIAENYYTRLDFKEAGNYAANALNICADDPKALDLARKLDDWDKGINILRQVEHILEKYDRDSSTDLAEAQKLLDDVKKLPVTFRDLNIYDLKWNSPAVYADEIENRIGIIGTIRLSIVPGKNYLVFVSDKITFGSPKDPEADLKIRAGGIKPKHGQIIRKKQEFYLSKHAGECMVCGEAAETRKLNLGDEIRLGKTFLFKVTALSKGCLVMIMDNSNPLDYSLEGIVMIDNTLDIGPEKNTHIRIPRLRISCQLLYHNQGFSLADESGETRLTLGQVQRVEDIQFLLTRES